MTNKTYKGKISEIFKSQLLKKTGVVFIFRILGMVLSYVAILFISNNYGADVYGRFSLSQTLLQFLLLLFSLGLGVSVVKLTSDPRFFNFNKPLNRYLKNSLVLLLVSSVVGAGLIFLLKEWLATTVFKDVRLINYFNYVALLFVFIVYQEFFTEFLRGRNKFVHYGLFKYLLPPAIFIGFLLLFRFLNFEDDTVILAYLLAFSILFVLLTFFFPFRKVNVKGVFSCTNLFTISFPMMFSAAFLFLSNWTDVFMLGAMVSKSEVGIYNAAYKLAILALIVINAVNTVLAPKISELYSKNSIEQIKIEVHKATRLITYATIPIVAILIIFREQLLGLFGEEFILGGNVLVIVSIGLLFNAMSGSVAQVLNMTQHQNTLKKITFISVIVNITLNYVLISSMGFVGAAVASLISNVTLNVLCVVYIKRIFGFYTFFIPWK